MPYAPQPVLSPQRLTAVAAVVLLHVGLILALKNGLAREVVALIKGPIDVQIIKDVVEPEKAPPPPQVKIETPPPFVPAPEIPIELAPDPPPTAIVAASVVAPSAAPPAAVAAPNAQVVSRTAPRLGKYFPDSEQYYPAASKRLNEEGKPRVNVCVGPDGRLSAPPKIEGSSGSSRLDEAALRIAKDGRYVPGTMDGKPTTACFSFMVRFEMKN